MIKNKERTKGMNRRKVCASPKFRRYRIVFCTYALLFFGAWILEMTVFGAQNRTVATQGAAFSRLFFLPAALEGGWYLLSYLIGVTVYAPVFGALSSILRGFCCGFVVKCLFSSLSDRASVYLFLCCLLYFILSAGLALAYGAFCSCVALRQFTDRTVKIEDEEKRLFGGTLFNSTFFAETINLRFLFTYTLFFLLAVFAALALLGLHVFIISRF